MLWKQIHDGESNIWWLGQPAKAKRPAGRAGSGQTQGAVILFLKLARYLGSPQWVWVHTKHYGLSQDISISTYQCSGNRSRTFLYLESFGTHKKGFPKLSDLLLFQNKAPTRNALVARRSCLFWDKKIVDFRFWIERSIQSPRWHKQTNHGRRLSMQCAKSMIALTKN